MPVCLALLVVVVSACGCGLDEYERLMLTEQKRIAYFDTEDKYLGMPVDMPPPPTAEDEKKQVQPVEIFFRAPKGISTKYDPTVLGTVTYRYLRTQKLAKLVPTPAPPGSAPGTPPTPPAKGPPTDAFEEVYLAAARDNKELFEAALQPFPGLNTANSPSVEKRPTGRPVLYFREVPLVDAQAQVVTYLYLFQQETIKVVIGYRVDAARLRLDQQTIEQVRDYSLGSLVVGPEATNLRKMFAGRNKGKSGQPAAGK
jgi:hypothetical protein